MIVIPTTPGWFRICGQPGIEEVLNMSIGESNIGSALVPVG